MKENENPFLKIVRLSEEKDESLPLAGATVTAQPAAENEKTVRTSLYLPESLHRAVRIKCLERGTSMTSVITGLLLEYVKEL